MTRMNLIHMMGLSLLLMLLPSEMTAAQEAIDTLQKAVYSADARVESPLSADEAAEAYRTGDYEKSIELYESIVVGALSENRESAALYYNLGNAYFRDNQLAKALLNYERAHLLDPGDGDIRHNLRFAQNRTEDRIEQAGTFFLKEWFKGVRDLHNSNRWAVISIILFLLVLICVAIFLFLRILWARKAAFYSGLVWLVLMIATMTFAFSQKRERLQRDEAIVMVGAATVNASPDRNSNPLFELHEGAKVKIRNSDGNWYEVEIANGSVGWTEKDNVAVI
ncbi:MAG: tetratricopeptide repeat protein [Proteiniphilum sp.]